MRTVELVYDNDCPNVERTRAQLMRAFAETGIPARWTEWSRDDPASPDYVRGYGSPTVLVDGRDVAGVAPSDGISCCRFYAGPSGEMRGFPSVQAIASALRASGTLAEGPSRPMRSVGWRSSLAALPGLGVTLLPVGICPACWPAYAGLLSALGIGFLLKTAYLLPVTAFFLLIAVGALGFRARKRRGHGPFVLGLAASAIVLLGKFALASNAAMYGGVCLLAAASFWNAWPLKAADGGDCPACAPDGQASRPQEPGAKGGAL